MRYVLTAIFGFLSAAQAVQGKSFYEDHARGWHWYEKIEEKKEEKSERENLKNFEKYPATEALKRYQAELEEAKAAAVMNPTAQNVLNYQRLQYGMIEKSGKFANVWMQNLYMNPNVDYTQKFPVS